MRYYGAWMREEAQKRIGHLYPPVEITAEMVKQQPDLKPMLGLSLTVVAWLWARTVKSPNPAFSHVDVPLASTFILCGKAGAEAYVEPIISNDQYRFMVKVGPAPQEYKNGTKLARGANFRCLLSDTAIEGDYIKSEGCAGRIGARLLAVVAEGTKGRVYVHPTAQMEQIAQGANPLWIPETPLPDDHRNFWAFSYGLTTFGHLFTHRQLVALTTFSDLVSEAGKMVRDDALKTRIEGDDQGLDFGGNGPTAYSEAVRVYLAFCVDKMTDTNTSLCSWQVDPPRLRATFGRQALPMVWDFAEANVFGDAAGDYARCIQSLVEVLERLGEQKANGAAAQQDAAKLDTASRPIISTDPPYYDNIAYADLSDFFYVWLRKALRDVFPSLLATIAVPKAEELIAAPYRLGSKEKAEAFFLKGMTEVMRRIASSGHPAFPVSIYYAFKQAETKVEGGTSSTGWVTFLEAVKTAGLAVLGTWPMRSELASRNVGRDTNALASSIVLVCRKRPADAPSISRREFIRELNGVLPEALDNMTRGNDEGASMKDEGKAGSALHTSSFIIHPSHTSPIAPVDLSQAIIGPGMAVFSKYAAVLEADGSPMSVRTALQLINRFLAEDDFDADTQFCLHWFEQNGWGEGVFGSADTLARAKSTSVDAMKEAGVLQSGSGKVRLLKWAEYPTDWDPRTDTRTPVWEALHQLIRALKQGGESASGALLAVINTLGGKAEAVRQLAYRLYTLCERLGQAEDARAYNELITSWTGIETAANSVPKPADAQLPGFER